MLIKHAFQYLLARGFPGLVNFAALAVYTRLLTVEDFGSYSLIVSTVGLVHVLVFQSLLLVLGRFLPANQDNPKVVMQPVLALFLTLAAGVVVLGAGMLFSGMAEEWRNLVVLALALSIAQAWHELNLRLATARLEPGRYSLLSGVKALLAVALGGWLAWLGWGANAPLLGLIAGALLSWFFFGRQPWRNVKPHWPDPETLKQYSTYGLPLAMTFVLAWVTSSSDRLMIAWLMEEAAVGLYSVGYDLAQHTLGLLLGIINTAALPLAIRALEHKGIGAASAQMRHNGELVFVGALAGAAGLLAIGPAMIILFVGEGFRAGASSVFPWIVVSAAISGIKSFYFDNAFHLTKKSSWLVLTSGLAALVNVIANLLLIPRFGISGAAWGTLVALLIAMVSSAWIGRRVFPMPPLWPLLVKGGGVAFTVYGSAYIASQIITMEDNVVPFLVLSLVTGSIAAVLAACLADVAGIRGVVLEKSRKYWRALNDK